MFAIDVLKENPHNVMLFLCFAQPAGKNDHFQGKRGENQVNRLNLAVILCHYIYAGNLIGKASKTSLLVVSVVIKSKGGSLKLAKMKIFELHG